MYTTHLLRLVAYLAEAILHGHAGEQLGAAHEGEVLRHLVVHALFHVLRKIERERGVGIEKRLIVSDVSAYMGRSMGPVMEF